MIGSLFLSPASPYDAVHLDPLEQTLGSLSVCGPVRHAGKDCRVYPAGEGFARHVVFAGCSPHLRFEPRDEKDLHYCHVALHGPFAQPRVLTGSNTVKPRCPHCRARIADWNLFLGDEELPCPGCGQKLTAHSLDWRQHAAVGRCFVEMRNVFPGEASPSDRLLAALKEISGFTWRYAWSGLYDSC